MKFRQLLLLAGAVGALAAPLAAQEPRPAARPAAQVLLAPAGAEQVIAELRAADDERVAAMLAADRDRLHAILSEALHYAHSNGVVDSKAAFIEALTSRRAEYRQVRYGQREFILAGDELALMTGRADVVVASAGRTIDLNISFLAVWRREAGRWRFLAWQSARLAPPAAP